MASSNSSVCASPMNGKMGRNTVFLRGERHWYFTGILNYCVPGRLWCSEVAICNLSSWSSTGPMISFKQGDCDCLAKPKYNNNKDLPSWFLRLLPVLYPAGTVSRTLIHSEIHSPNIRAVTLPPGLFRCRYSADTDTLCRSWEQLCSGSWASAWGASLPLSPGMRWIFGRCERGSYCWFLLCLLALALYTPCLETSINTHLN